MSNRALTGVPGLLFPTLFPDSVSNFLHLKEVFGKVNLIGS